MTVDLAPLLGPDAIAVIGASTEPGKVGGMPIRLLRANGYPGAIYPVHRTATEIQGLPAYRSIRDVGRPIDLAIVAVPAAACLDAVGELVDAGVRAAVVFTSGFAETGAAGAALQETLAATAARAGVVLLGPNCLGAIDLRRSVFATFSPVVLDGVPPAGDVALVSQSGAFGGYAFALARRAGLGLSSWITTGNEAGVQVADAIRWLVDDDETRVVLAYVEGARDLRRFEAALDAARAAGKPVALVKAGTTAAGAHAARLHTGSDVGDDAAWTRLLDAYGVHRADTLTALLRLGTVLSRGRRPAVVAAAPRTDGCARDGASGSKRSSAPTSLAILTISGGVGIVMADRAAARGLAMPPLPPGPAAALVDAVPFATTDNPIDLTGQVFARPDVLIAALSDVARCGAYGYAVVFLAAAGRVPGLWMRIQQCIVALLAEPSAAPLLFCGVFDDAQRDWLVAQGSLVFEEPTDAIDAVATLSRVVEAGAVAADPEPTHTERATARDAPPTRALTGPLAGLRVVEFAGIGPGPFACMLLSDLGAEVVTVDRPGRGPANPVVGRGRTIVEADLKDAAARDAVVSLVDRADVIVEGYRPGVMERLGLGPDVVAARNPRLVYGRMTGWGQHGPLAKVAGHDIDYIAITGALHAIGTADSGPVPPLNLVGDFGGGSLYLVMGLLAALLERERSGRGQVVDAAIVDGTLSLLSGTIAQRLAGEFHDRRASNRLDGGTPYYGVYETADGRHVAVGPLERTFFDELCTRLGLGDAWHDAHRDRSRWPALRAEFARVFRTKTQAAWTALLEATDACCAPVLPLGEADRHPHLVARGAFVDVGGTRQPAPAPRFSRTPGTVQGPAPASATPIGDVAARWAAADRIDGR